METQHINNSIPQFSFFIAPVNHVKPIIPHKTATPAGIFKYITGHYAIKNTLKLRSITDKKEANKFKCDWFNYACFSGTFSERNEAGLIKHSGLLTIDFDHITHKEKLRESLLADPLISTVLLFTSPSGTGIKWIVKIDLNQGTHLENFQAIENYIDKTYQIKIDSSGKDIARPCFLPYDPECHFNQAADKKYLNVADWLPVKPEIKSNPGQNIKPVSTNRPGNQKTFFDVLQEIEKNQIDIAPHHDQWMKLGFIIADNFGERGREYFKRLSRFYNGRIIKTPDQQYNDCLKGKKPGSVRMNTFFQYAKEAGIEI